MCLVEVATEAGYCPRSVTPVASLESPVPHNPCMSSAIRLTFAVVIHLGLVACFSADPDGFGHAWRCSQIEEPAAVEIDGRRLVEIPDIVSPEMRRANLQLSSGCESWAEEAVATLLRREPGNVEALYVRARVVWVARGADGAEAQVLDLVRRHPEFVSGHVLLSGLRFDQGRYDEAARILDEVEDSAPADMWVWLNRVRIEALTTPSDSARERLRSTLRNSQFPPNIRESAAFALRRSQNVSMAEFEDSYAARLDYDSMYRFGCKLRDYAFWLMESQGRFDDGIQVIESHMGRNFECRGMLGDAWDFLAYGTLVKAAEISPVPTRANEAYTEKARDAVQGDFSNLAAWLVGRPRESMLAPFIVGDLDVEETDQYGRTRICNGVLLLNPTTVRTELERGANPDGDCVGDSLVQYLTLMGGRDKIAERQAVLRLLLEHGARPGDVSYCRREGNGVCPTALVPVFEEFGLL